MFSLARCCLLFVHQGSPLNSNIILHRDFYSIESYIGAPWKKFSRPYLEFMVN